ARLAHPRAPEVRSSVHERLRAQRPDGRCDDEEEQSQRYTAHDGPLPGVRCFARPFSAIAFHTPHSALASPPFAHPPVVQHGDDAALLEDLDARWVAVGLAI